MVIREAIAKVVDGIDLTESEAQAVMDEIMSGQATPSQIAAYITALRMKGETVDEIAGSARVMRVKADQIRPRAAKIVDTCGTGGDGSQTFNISTAAAFVVAGAGATVAKHGNRSVSSRCGSADVLEQLGVRIDLTPLQVQQCIDDVGIGFLFAPTFHGAMKYAVNPRKEIGIRTIFNILGPLTNPAGAHVQVVGVYKPELTPILAEVLGRLGVEMAYVVHGLDRLDEISISAPTQVSLLQEGKVTTQIIEPEDFGLQTASRESVIGGDSVTNAQIIQAVLAGEKGAPRDVVLMNAAAALVVTGLADNLKDGVALAADSIDSGKALAKLEALRDYTIRSCA